MKKTMSSVAALAAVLLVAGSAGAQVCAGFPIRDSQGSIGALASFPSGVNNFGVEGAYNLAGPLSINAGYIRSEETGGGTDSQDGFRAGVAFDISSVVGAMLPGVSVCPNVRADFVSESGVNGYVAPVGLGLGVSLPVGGPGMSLSPYAVPALYVFHVDGFDTETEFGVRGGADLSVDRFYFGGTVEWVNGPGSDAVFGVRAGIKF
jgi:hypothetical protein